MTKNADKSINHFFNKMARNEPRTYALQPTLLHTYLIGYASVTTKSVFIVQKSYAILTENGAKNNNKDKKNGKGERKYSTSQLGRIYTFDKLKSMDCVPTFRNCIRISILARAHDAIKCALPFVVNACAVYG